MVPSSWTHPSCHLTEAVPFEGGGIQQQGTGSYSICALMWEGVG